MVCGLSHLLLLALCSMILTTSSGINIKKYRLFGPMMCMDVCGDSGSSFFLVKEYHCHRFSKKDPKTFITPTSKDTFLCTDMQKMAKDGTYLRSSERVNISNSSTKDTFHLRGQHTTKSTPNEKQKPLKCKNNKLHSACEAGKLTEVKRILAAGNSINCRGRSGWTPVMAAAMNGQVAVFDFLVSYKCDLSAVNDRNNTVIHVACRGGSIDIIRKIVDIDKYQLERRGENEMTPVQTAAWFCWKDVVDFLINKHCNMSVVVRGNENILHWASMAGCKSVVDYVLSNDIQSIESQDKEGRTPLLIAAYSCERKLFRYLITKGGNVTAVDKRGNNHLHLACIANCRAVVDYILSEHIISRESRNKNGHTPLMVAVYRGNTEMVEFLLSKGCSLKAVDENYNNILHLACLSGEINMLKYLLTQKELDWNKKNKAGETPMQIVESRNMKTVVDLRKASTG